VVALLNDGPDSDSTVSKHSQRGLIRWKPGQSGNPKGRPEGARNKLATEYFVDLYESWQKHGKEWQKHGKAALDTVAMLYPNEYVKIVAGHMPREMNAVVTNIHHLERVSDQRLLEIIGSDSSAPQIPDATIVQPVGEN